MHSIAMNLENFMNTTNEHTHTHRIYLIMEVRTKYEISLVSWH